jgi:hypothetical protein
MAKTLTVRMDDATYRLNSERANPGASRTAGYFVFSSPRRQPA